MTKIKLYGHFSFIDKYRRLKFVWTDDESRSKLDRNCPDGVKPFDEEGFTVVLSKFIKKIPVDILSKVGLDCTIYVKCTRYDFVSKLEKNYGERVQGTYLVLENILTGTL